MAVQTKSVQQIVHSVSSVKPLWTELKQMMFGQINIEITNVCRIKDPTAVDPLQREASLLLCIDCKLMESLSWNMVTEEMKKRCPLTLAVIKSLTDGMYLAEKKLPVVCLIYSLCCFARNAFN